MMYHVVGIRKIKLLLKQALLYMIVLYLQDGGKDEKVTVKRALIQLQLCVLSLLEEVIYISKQRQGELSA